MCGIAGLVVTDSTDAMLPPQGASALSATVVAMVGALDHRGPDRSDIASAGAGTVGTARLAVCDPAGSAQPMADPQSGVTVAFNGEVYGYRELRRKLADNGYQFRTNGDTEVLLALYARHGVDMVHHLPGMFAFALWDPRRATLLCARDRFGEKPLYWAKRGPTVLVGSEPKALLASGLVKPNIDREVLGHVLQYSFVPPTRCIYRDIEVLPPAHRLVVRGGQVLQERYWDPPAVRWDMSSDEALDGFTERFDKAVGRQIDADVPVGVLLSGGIDSSAVTASAANQLATSPTAYTFEFGAGIESERPYADLVATDHDLPHVIVSDTETDLASDVVALFDHLDEPLADSSVVPGSLVARRAAEDVKVVLGGDGADELLGGYLVWSRNFLPGADTSEQGRRKPMDAVRSMASAVVHRVGARAPSTLSNSPSLVERYVGFRRYFDDSERRALGLGGPTFGPADLTNYRTDGIDDLLRFDLDTYLPGDILVKTDRSAMMHGLEVRSPFLDTDLAEFCLTVPPVHKVDGASEKLLLRKAFRSRLPEAVIDRPKQGFGGPTDEWLAGPLADLRGELLDNRSSALFDHIGFDVTRAAASEGGQRTWTLFSLALWLDGLKRLSP